MSRMDEFDKELECIMYPTFGPPTLAEHLRNEKRKLARQSEQLEQQASRAEEDAVRPSFCGELMPSVIYRREPGLIEFNAGGVRVYEWDRSDMWNCAVYSSKSYGGGAIATIEVKNNSARFSDPQGAADCAREGLLLLRAKIDELLGD